MKITNEAGEWINVSKQKLHPCPDCGREISKRALACPNCGRRIAFGTVIGSAIFWTLLALLVFVWFVVSLLKAVS
jgi:predicted RNA-binding Zn-ribbon protein involved in translation (DUF1610 family)